MSFLPTCVVIILPGLKITQVIHLGITCFRKNEKLTICMFVNPRISIMYFKFLFIYEQILKQIEIFDIFILALNKTSQL